MDEDGDEAGGDGSEVETDGVGVTVDGRDAAGFFGGPEFVGDEVAGEFLIDSEEARDDEGESEEPHDFYDLFFGGDGVEEYNEEEYGLDKVGFPDAGRGAEVWGYEE